MRTIGNYFARISRFSTIHFSTLFKQYQLGSGEHRILSLLGDYPDGIKQEDVAAALYLNKGVVTRMATRLLQKGFIQIGQNPSDRRVKKLFLTAKGFAILPYLEKARWDWQQVLLQELDIKPEALEKILAHIEANAYRAILQAKEMPQE